MPDILSKPATMKELSDYYAKKQPHQVDSVTEDAPILNSLKFEAASHGLWNMYEDVTGISGASFVDMDAPLPNVDVNTDLKKQDLGIMGGIIEVPEDKAKMFGGKEKYLAKKMPTILRQTGSETEKAILYKNLREYALRNGKAISAGASTNDCYSIIALREVPGETIGLYSPEGFKSGAMVDVSPISGGNLYKNQQGVLVYGMRLKAYFGYQIANPYTVASIVNINKTNKPTPDMLDELLATIKATPTNTKLLMHEKMRTLLFSLKGSVLQVSVGDKDIDRRITHWNGVEVLTSYNFLDGTEKKENA